MEYFDVEEKLDQVSDIWGLWFNGSDLNKDLRFKREGINIRLWLRSSACTDLNDNTDNDAIKILIERNLSKLFEVVDYEIDSRKGSFYLTVVDPDLKKKVLSEGEHPEDEESEYNFYLYFPRERMSEILKEVLDVTGDEDIRIGKNAVHYSFKKKDGYAGLGVQYKNISVLNKHFTPKKGVSVAIEE